MSRNDQVSACYHTGGSKSPRPRDRRQVLLDLPTTTAFWSSRCSSRCHTRPFGTPSDVSGLSDTGPGRRSVPGRSRGRGSGRGPPRADRRRGAGSTGRAGRRRRGVPPRARTSASPSFGSTTGRPVISGRGPVRSVRPSRGRLVCCSCAGNARAGACGGSAPSRDRGSPTCRGRGEGRRSGSAPC